MFHREVRDIRKRLLDLEQLLVSKGVIQSGELDETRRKKEEEERKQQEEYYKKRAQQWLDFWNKIQIGTEITLVGAFNSVSGLVVSKSEVAFGSLTFKATSKAKGFKPGRIYKLDSNNLPESLIDSPGLGHDRVSRLACNFTKTGVREVK